MKIGQKLALRFTLVSALLTGAILIFIYMATRGFVHSDFEERLIQQSRLEVLHYATPTAKDVIPPGSFLFEDPFTSIFTSEGKIIHKKGEFEIPKSWISYMQNHPTFTTHLGTYTTVGRKYTINGIAYIVFVSEKDYAGEHELKILLRTVIIGWILSLVLSYLAGVYFAGNALQPVKHVVKEVNQITKDNLGYRLKHGKAGSNFDEIDELIITFNALLTRIESAFVAQKRFVQNASHELKTPLTAIMAEAELALARDRSQDEYRRTLNVVVGETERLISITQGLLTLARLEEGFLAQNLMEIVQVKNLVDTTVNTFMRLHPNRKVNVKDVYGSISAMGNQQLLQIAIMNMMDNARKYSEGDIDVAAMRKDNFVYISVSDTGIGIPENELSRVKSALYRASNVPSGQGAGLGLTLVDRIAAVHNGELEIESKVNQGTRCVLTIPELIA